MTATPLPTISTEADARPSAVDEAEGGTVPPSSATPSRPGALAPNCRCSGEEASTLEAHQGLLATLPTWGERRNTGRGPWRPFDGSEPDVDPETGDERATDPNPCPTCGGTSNVWGPGGVVYATTVEGCPDCNRETTP